MSVAVVIPAAGEGRRTGLKENKMFFCLDGEPIIKKTVWAFLNHPLVDTVCVVCAEKDFERMQSILGKSVVYAFGGSTREESVFAGLKEVADSDKVLIHDGARPFVSADVISRVTENTAPGVCAVAGVKVTDTLKTVEGDRIISTVDRNGYFRAQTPQGFMTKEIISLFENGNYADLTDDSQLFERAGKQVKAVEGEEKNRKITTPEDVGNTPVYLVGTGYDVHRFSENRKLVLGGVEIPYEKGLLGHSDADVLLHAVCDAILGAAGEGDIGKHFPDTDERYRGIKSTVLLENVNRLIAQKGFRVINVSAVVVAQKPKLLPYIAEMNANIARILNTNRVNVAATTTEKLGFEGREEGISAMAVVLLTDKEGGKN